VAEIGWRIPVLRPIRLFVVPGVLAGSSILYSCAPKEAGVADLILTGGVVWDGTGAESRDFGEPTAVAIADGKVLAVGTDEEIEAVAGRGTQRLDLMGRRVVPGFIDAHTHFIDGGFELASVQLRDADTPAEFVRRIGEFAAAHPDEWMIGGLWDHEAWGGELPRRDWIDSVTPKTPVLVSRLDAHMALANSLALELAGVTADTPDPPGGTIVRHADGRPTGILKDAASELVSRVMPARSEDALDAALQAAVQHAAERGVTMIGDMGYWEGLETYRRAHAHGELPIRVYSVVQIDGRDRMKAYIEQHGKGDHRLFWGGVKAFVDGSLGSTTAWFYDPYADEPETSGLIVSDTTELRNAIIEADRAGLQVIVHAIGDRANDWILDVYAEARELNGERDRRARIEHAQHLSMAAIPRFGAEGVIPSMQPYHAADDGRWAVRRIGPERIKRSYMFRDLLDAGAVLAFGSDWTVALIDPLLGIHSAVTRRTLDGANPDGWLPEQKITVAEAVAGYTTGAAYACFMEDFVGTIEPGKYADLVVLSDDIFSIDPVEIENVRVDLTMVEGEVVFRR
jgi:predicted amidohydrolase YtcJ